MPNMNNVSPSRRFALKKAARTGPITNEYRILDQNHKPDLNGELAGGKVYFSGTEQRVRLTAAQAKFYIDQGQLELVV